MEGSTRSNYGRDLPAEGVSLQIDQGVEDITGVWAHECGKSVSLSLVPYNSCEFRLVTAPLTYQSQYSIYVF
jgi:hypothetical protein